MSTEHIEQTARCPSSPRAPLAGEVASASPASHSQWPSLIDLGLSKEQLARRTKSLGGSDANTIMSGNPDWVRELWMFKSGHCPADDLSNELRVMMGHWTEEFNRLWFMRRIGGTIHSDNHQARCATHPWRTSTLDGVLDDLKVLPCNSPVIFEAKHVSGDKPFDEVLAYYMPQLQHNMDVTGLKGAVISVFMGTKSHEWEYVPYDEEYCRNLLRAEKNFWGAVQSGVMPVFAETQPEKEEEPKFTRAYDLCGSNEWGSEAASFLETYPSSKKHDASKKALKKMIPDDAKECFGHGVKAARSKSGAITIKPMEKV